MELASQQILKRLVRKTSLSRLVALLNKADIEIQEISENPDIATHWNGIIFITSDSLKVDFKTQCDAESAQLFSNQLRQGRKVSPNSDTGDFMHEYCNMVGGYIKNTLDQQQVVFKLSLPLITQSNASLVYNTTSDTNIFYDQWKLVSGNSYLFCSVTFAAKENVVLNGEILEFTDSGEIKFL